MKETSILEHPVPKGCYPWSLTLENRGNDEAVVKVHGASGGKKAIFGVRLSELKEAIRKIE